MLRRIPYTLLVCLGLLASCSLLSTSWAATPDESLDVLLKPNNSNLATSPVVKHSKSRRPHSGFPTPWSGNPAFQGPCPITKVKAQPPAVCQASGPGMGLFLPTPKPGQWQIGVQGIYARTRGTIKWPRDWWMYMGTAGQNADFNDSMGLPCYWTIPELLGSYQFRCNWSIQFSFLGMEEQGSQYPNDFFYFGWFPGAMTPWLWGPGMVIQTRWQHDYGKIGLLYDAIKSYKGVLSIFGGYMHADNRFDGSSVMMSIFQTTFDKMMDTAAAGLEFQKCQLTQWNGGTFSADAKITGLFGDNVNGYDFQVGGKYSIPMNCGRWGYMKGGYRIIDLKEGQNDFWLETCLEGGYLEMGFIF
ncbi:MAG: hypothetical protein ACP5VS_16620 [Desulfomonilaceae bacterium]